MAGGAARPGPLRGAKLFAALRLAPARRGALLTVRRRNAPAGERAGIGMAVSAKVGGAVVRNKIRRRLRTSWRLLMAERPETALWQLFIQVQPAAARADFRTLDDEFRRLIVPRPA